MTKQINSNNDLLNYLLEQSLLTPKNWFGYFQQKILSVPLAYSIAANFADKMSPKEIVDYVVELNNELHSSMIKKG
jgi:hypothetical protein